MLTQEDDVEIHALAKRGWNKSAIARHTGRDRKTVRKYLAGDGAGQNRRPAPSCLEPFRAYLEARFVDDPRVEVTVIYRELVDAGFDRSYPTLVREIRRLELRPVCVTCQHRTGRVPTVEIEHPPGEEIQWDWLELPVTPWGEPGFVLVGTLAHSSRFRAVFCEQMTFGHLAAAAHRIVVGLGGTAQVWRTDRMATVVVPGTDRLTVDMANLAKHYGVEVAVCPPRRAQRKGVVEKAIQYLTNSWWRTALVHTPGEAQASLDAWSERVADQRPRGESTVGLIGAGEPLLKLPPLPYPAMITVQRQASRSALVSFDGNRYSVPPVHAGRTVTVQTRVGEPSLRVVSKAGEVVATHRLAPPSAGQIVRTLEHAQQLEKAVLAAFTTDHACRRKVNRPPERRRICPSRGQRGPIRSRTGGGRLERVCAGCRHQREPQCWN
jgi:transposase